MTRKLSALGLILMFAFALYAQGDKQVKITGYIIDNACASGHTNDANFSARVKKHSTECALMPNCEGSGYSVFANGKLYKLDTEGNKTAADLLKDTETKNGVMVAVEGTLDGETIKVTKLTEVKTAAS
jgi:hypothetical protein